VLAALSSDSSYSEESEKAHRGLGQDVGTSSRGRGEREKFTGSMVKGRGGRLSRTVVLKVTGD